MKMSLNEKDFKLFKKWLKSHLAYGPVTVIFTKRDGSERAMLCTTSEKLVPVHTTNTSNPIDFPVKYRAVNEDVQPVYDLEAKAWRSFRWDSIKKVEFTI